MPDQVLQYTADPAEISTTFFLFGAPGEAANGTRLKSNYRNSMYDPVR